MHRLYHSLSWILLLASAHAFARMPHRLPTRALSNAVFPLRTPPPSPPPAFLPDVSLECAARHMLGEPWFFGNVSEAPVLNATNNPNTQPPTTATDHAFPSAAISVMPVPVPPRPFPGGRENNPPQLDYEDLILLQGELQRLKQAFSELCAAIVRSDDIVLLERDLLHRGTIWSASPSMEVDPHFVERIPITLRSRVMHLTNKHKIALPVEESAQ